MFVCQLCGEVAPPRTPSHRLVIATTRWIFPTRRFAQTEPPDPERQRPRRKKPLRKRRHLVTDPGGVGTQIRGEALACPTCFAAARPIDPRP